jgi:heat shock protein HslJ
MYFSLMAAATTYSVNGDTMLLFDSSGKAILAYKRPLDIPVTLPAQAPVVGSWDLLTYYNGNNAMVSVLSGSNITAIFTPDGRINGSSGCNGYSALYSLNGQTLGISQVKSTKMACDPEIMVQENQYLALLQKVNTYEMNGDQMVLYTVLGQKILQFKKGHAGTISPPKSTPSTSPRTLVGAWVLKSYTDGKGGAVPVMAAAPVTAKFLADGSLSGSSGCNQYSTTYSTSGESISISQAAATTRMACEPAVMVQETAYLTILPKAGKFVIFGDSMTLYDSTGSVLLSYKAP